MNTVPLWVQILALILLILLSAFFSMSETALMAANRHRLRHLAAQGNRHSRIVLWLLERTNKLLSLILIANTLLNALATALVTALAITIFGNHEKVITIATICIAILLIIFAEIVPKIIGATHPERISLFTSIILKPLMQLAKPLISFVNLFVSGILRLLRIPASGKFHEQRLSPEELRSIVLEGSHFITQKHKSILLNLFDLEKISVEDVMTPRAQIEALDLSIPIEEIVHQLTTCYYSQLPVYEGEINQIMGILHVRKALALLHHDEPITTATLRSLLTAPYFIPRETDVLTQLHYFQENHERLAMIVDEYGEVQGLVTLEDIIEEIVGDFTTAMPRATRANRLVWNEKGICLLDGSMTLRDINKHLGLDFPLDGPKTLNGLLLERLQEIPEANTCLKIADCVIEIVQVYNQVVKVAKLYRCARE